MNRRSFLLGGLAGAGVTLVPGVLGAVPRASKASRLVILHTNDWHSRIDPFPDDGGHNAGRGGAERRMALIHRIRYAEPHVLLLDSGDIFQGTPYFNFFLGELEMKLMSRMGYDAATIGNHDFDGGMENLARQMEHADFPMLTANYDFKNTPLEGRTQPYQTFEKAGMKIGVFGLGIELAGLVPAALYGKTDYQDPIEVGNRTAALLKTREKCDLVICLSHLGFRYREEKVDDVTFAAASRDVDIILGGHTHTFLDEPVTVNNQHDLPVIVNQVGFGGLRLGRLDVTLRPGGVKNCVACSNLLV